jgi:hypothetical protein
MSNYAAWAEASSEIKDSRPRKQMFPGAARIFHKNTKDHLKEIKDSRLCLKGATRGGELSTTGGYESIIG